MDLTYGLLNEGCKVATLGPLIHNPQAVEDMQKKGALVADAIADVPAGYEVVIRSHGVPRTVYDELDARGITYHDATCPFVQKIQRIAAEAEKAGAVLLVAYLFLVWMCVPQRKRDKLPRWLAGLLVLVEVGYCFVFFKTDIRCCNKNKIFWIFGV